MQKWIMNRFAYRSFHWNDELDYAETALNTKSIFMNVIQIAVWKGATNVPIFTWTMKTR